MPINLGDAVLKFLGDSSQLDTKFDEVQPKAKKAFGSAADAVEEGTGRMKASISEARGEAMLLGEEIGVRMPRHVTTFLAELPGVGEVLSSAFSATAVLFLAKALTEVTTKATDFVSNSLIYTRAMKDSNEATVEVNKALLEQAENYDKAKDSLEKFGAAGTDSLRLQLASLRGQLAATKNLEAEGPKLIDQSKQATHEYIQQTGWLSRGYDVIKSWVTGTKDQVSVLQGATAAAQNKYLVDAATVKALQEQEALLEKQLETEHKLEAIKQGGETGSAQARLRAAQKQTEVAEDSNTAAKRKQIAEQLEDELYRIKYAGMQKQLTILRENDENTKDAQAKLLSEMKVAADAQATIVLDRLVKSKDELEKSLQEIAKTVQQTVPDIQIVTPSSVKNMLDAAEAAHRLGITLRTDLVTAYNDAKKAEYEFVQSGIQDTVARKALGAAVDDARRKLEEFGQTEDKLKIKTETTWKGFQQDLKQGANAMHELSDIGEEAFNDLSKDIQGAFQQIVLGQGSVTQALEKALAQQLAAIASQAAVKAIFYTAEGFAALAGFNGASAGQYFTAAAEMAAVAVAAGVAGRALSGAGGAGTSTQQLHTSESNTTSRNSGGTSAIGVQAFATGGLISQPTLAMIGEGRRREAVLPLEDSRAMKQIAEAIGSQGGGGVHIHLPHGSIISADVLHKFVSKMNKMVTAGKLNVLASNALRVTKRSA